MRTMVMNQIWLTENFRTTNINLKNRLDNQQWFGANFKTHPTLIATKERGMGHLLLYYKSWEPFGGHYTSRGTTI